MQYIEIIICVAAIIILGVIYYSKWKNQKDIPVIVTKKINEITVKKMNEEVGTDTIGELVIQLEKLPVDAINGETKLVEITDRKVLAHVNNLIPELAQAGNAVNNAMQAVHAANRGVLYRVVIPAGTKLTNSKAMEGAVRGIYHGPVGIKGHANLVAVEAQKGTAVVANTAAVAMNVASMVVGQYYMSQINTELGKISDGISQIQDFQNNEYRSRVFSLVVHVKKITDFQAEIIENDELRLSKITQLDNLEEECSQLLGQANITLANFAKKTDLDYETYERALGNAQNWFMYQKSLLDVLYKISDLRYTLCLGAVSREQCVAVLPTYTRQVSDTQELLKMWHDGTTQRLGIKIDEFRRKRVGFDGIIHFIPGLIKDDFNFRSIEKKTAKMIAEQVDNYDSLYLLDSSELYSEDVQLISKNGKIYYLPESIITNNNPHNHYG